MGSGDSTEETVDSWKQFWRRRLQKLDKYKEILDRDKPLPSRTDADVEDFIESDPVYGPQFELLRQTTKIAATGSLIGAVSTAGVTLKYSKSGIGALLSFGAGAAFGWVFAKEIANHTLQLYKFDTMDSQIKFIDWWEKKTEGRS